MVRDGINNNENQPTKETIHYRIGRSLSPAAKWKMESLTRRVASREMEMVGSALKMEIIAQRAQCIRSRSLSV